MSAIVDLVQWIVNLETQVKLQAAEIEQLKAQLSK